MTVIPGRADSAELTDIPEPQPKDGELLVEPVRLGVCGTDREILDGDHGEPPPGHERLVIGHELLGRVKEAGGGFEEGQLVAGIVRRPDPVPCACCARGEWDMCRNGEYTERGIKGLDGYGAELVTIEPDFAIPIPDELGELGVLTEPSSVLAKAWEQIGRIATRACNVQERVLVTGAGPIGLLAALMGVQRGLDVHVYDHNKGGPKEALTRDLGGSYHSDAESLARISPDVLIECTGVPAVIRDCLGATGPAGIVCLTGVTEPKKIFELDVGAINRTMVLDNDCVFGTVNANRRHYEMAAQALARADKSWLARLITRRVPLDRWSEALEHRKGDIKVIVDFTQ